MLSLKLDLLGCLECLGTPDPLKHAMKGRFPFPEKRTHAGNERERDVVQAGIRDGPNPLILVF
jgi:hypothetical protein